MLWIVVLVLLLLILWPLFSTLELKVDTRVPVIAVQWISIGKITLVYETGEWWLKIGILFYYREWSLLQLILAPGKREKRGKKISGKKNRSARSWIIKLVKILNSFQIKEWQLAIDTGDYAQNATLFPVNYLSYTRQHVRVNFIDENFLVLRIRNTPWRILYALAK